MKTLIIFLFPALLSAQVYKKETIKTEVTDSLGEVTIVKEDYIRVIDTLTFSDENNFTVRHSFMPADEFAKVLTKKMSEEFEAHSASEINKFEQLREGNKLIRLANDIGVDLRDEYNSSYSFEGNARLIYKNKPIKVIITLNKSNIGIINTEDGDRVGVISNFFSKNLISVNIEGNVFRMYKKGRMFINYENKTRLILQ